MKRVKPFLYVLSAIFLIVVSAVGTLAYLTDTSEVVNTFTVGNVDLKLDEAVVDVNGKPVEGGERTEEGNEYHLVPGQEYTKDPTVTVIKGSEESYVRMLLTINCASQLDEIFAPSGAVLTDIFKGYDEESWNYETVTRENDKIIYEFRYNEKVKPESDSDLELEALFTSITVPATMTGEQLQKIADLEIHVEAHAIQTAGFADVAEAWEAFSK